MQQPTVDVSVFSTAHGSGHASVFVPRANPEDVGAWVGEGMRQCELRRCYNGAAVIIRQNGGQLAL